MSTPISKAITRKVIASSEKVTACCQSKQFQRVNDAGALRFICTNPACTAAKDGDPTTKLILPEGAVPTLYHIRPLPPITYGRLMDEAGRVAFSSEKESLSPHDMVVKWVRAGLIGWENFDAQFEVQTDEKFIIASRPVPTESTVNEIPYDDLLDIAWEVKNFHRLTEEEKKK